jgi:hypothetical protein
MLRLPIDCIIHISAILGPPELLMSCKYLHEFHRHKDQMYVFEYIKFNKIYTILLDYIKILDLSYCYLIKFPKILPFSLKIMYKIYD